MSEPEGGDWEAKKAGPAGSGDAEDSYQERKDADHLKILSIIWYVMSGLALIGVCLGIGYTIMGLGVAAGPGSDDAAFGGAFACIGVGVIVMSLLGSALNFFVGRNLSRRKGHLFCLIMSGLTCLSFPLGTALGIFTIVVLLRPTVKKAFGVA